MWHPVATARGSVTTALAANDGIDYMKLHQYLVREADG